MSGARAAAELRSAWPGLRPGPTRGGAGNKCWAAKRLSPKWRVTISSGSRIAVRLTRAFQRISRLMYVDISGIRSWVLGLRSLGPKNGSSSSAMRAGSIGFPIVECGVVGEKSKSPPSPQRARLGWGTRRQGGTRAGLLGQAEVRKGANDFDGLQAHRDYLADEAKDVGLVGAVG